MPGDRVHLPIRQAAKELECQRGLADVEQPRPLEQSLEVREVARVVLLRAPVEAVRADGSDSGRSERLPAQEAPRSRGGVLLEGRVANARHGPTRDRGALLGDVSDLVREHDLIPARPARQHDVAPCGVRERAGPARRLVRPRPLVDLNRGQVERHQMAPLPDEVCREGCRRGVAGRGAHIAGRFGRSGRVVRARAMADALRREEPSSWPASAWTRRRTA